MSKQTKIATALLGVATVLATGAFAYSQRPTAPEGVSLSAQECTLSVADLTDDQIAGLRAHGWHGDPSDGEEVLYRPGCGQ